VSASIELFKHARGEILEEARQTPGLHRPANVYRIAVATFERGLACLLLAAFRGGSPIGLSADGRGKCWRHRSATGTG
jgi:hypothetical protein